MKKLIFYKMILSLGRPNARERAFIGKLRLNAVDDAFFRKFFPKREVNEIVILLDLKRIELEINELTPGAFINPFGYFPIAASYGGALFCVNEKYRNSEGFIRISKIYPDSKDSLSSEDLIESKCEFVCYGLREFYYKCFYDESID